MIYRYNSPRPLTKVLSQRVVVAKGLKETMGVRMNYDAQRDAQLFADASLQVAA